jgi:uncharacterized protein
MKLDGSSALVTGASVGLGREFARQLASRASSIVLVARRGQQLEEVQAELTALNPNLPVRIRVVDLSEKTQVAELCQWLTNEKLEIDLLINNAGLGDLGPFATSDPARNDQIILVNMLALTALTRQLLPALIQKKRGAILNVSSSAGFMPISDFSVYAASKAYVTSFSEGLRAELRGTGVSVCALCPGPVHTEFSKIAQRSGPTPYRSAPEIAYVSPEAVVREALAAIESDRPLVIPGFIMKIAMTFTRMTPMPILRLVSHFTAKRA